MTALLTMLAAKATPYIIGGGAITLIVLTALGKAFKAGKDTQRAKEADSYEKSLKDLADAANARPTGKLSDDPYNRDNR